MKEERAEYLCNRCLEMIEKKTMHIVVDNKAHFHIECWEKEKLELKQKYGTI